MTPTEKCISGTIIILLIIADTLYSIADNRKTILVTGGGGYIGSHTVVELLNRNYSVVVIDNLSNCYARNPSEKPESLKRVEDLTGRGVVFYDVDIRNTAALEKLFQIHSIDAVIHFAALKSVSESVEKPADYYENNVAGTNNLLQVMKKHKVYCIIYSSSATVYGEPEFLPLTERHPTGQKLTNPYGRSKYFTEEILKDITATNSEWRVILLRYFNPVGAHPSGSIGEDPFDIPNNLMPYISQVAVGRRSKLNIFGSDYPTKDGTGVRDFIHISDLAVGHLRALKKIFSNKFKGWKVYNLGTGKGYSVLDMVKAFERASGRRINYEFTKRRPGDISAVYADASLAKRELNWKAEKGIDEMCEDTWNWQRRNPNGYR
ncbi:hypothetical protein WA026_009645 [Henosepilachna vigintioctopunctata]|uniref:UDP-glucose 4-epimerase n=1 Tax=Henosepilachna vigintioctopunctata TaxID=420089 RepID=A0AAW1TZZ6_9CUCU